MNCTLLNWRRTSIFHIGSMIEYSSKLLHEFLLDGARFLNFYFSRLKAVDVALDNRTVSRMRIHIGVATNDSWLRAGSTSVPSGSELTGWLQQKDTTTQVLGMRRPSDKVGGRKEKLEAENVDSVYRLSFSLVLYSGLVAWISNLICKYLDNCQVKSGLLAISHFRSLFFAWDECPS